MVPVVDLESTSSTTSVYFLDRPDQARARRHRRRPIREGAPGEVVGWGFRLPDGKTILGDDEYGAGPPDPFTLRGGHSENWHMYRTTLIAARVVTRPSTVEIVCRLRGAQLADRGW
jgi:hypothetical protein